MKIKKLYFFLLFMLHLLASCTKVSNVPDSEPKAKVIVPHDIKFWLSDEQIQLMEEDSAKYWKVNEKIAKTRKDSLGKIPFLRATERTEMIKDSIHFWQKNKQLAFNRKNREQQQQDSLRLVNHPVDSIIPFGPKILGHLISQNIDHVGLDMEDVGTSRKEKEQIRNDLIEIKSFFTEVHPDAEIYDNGGYPNRKLPPIKTYQHIDYLSQFVQDESKFSPINANFTLRLSDVSKYEVYYATGIFNSSVECLIDCTGSGYLIFYDRKEQHSVVLDAFVAGDPDHYFYLENNSVHVFKMQYSKKQPQDGQRNGQDTIEPIDLTYVYHTKILDNGDFISNKVCLLWNNEDHYDFPGHFGLEKYNRLDVLSKTTTEQHELSYNQKRDSIQKILLLEKYPFGPSTLVGNDFSEGTFSNNSSHKITLDSVLAFVYDPPIYDFDASLFALPIPKSIRKIELGGIETWSPELLESHYRTPHCWNNYSGDYESLSRYQLPSIGPLEIYFSHLWQKGVLTLYDPKTEIAQVMNVLDIRESYFRVFSIQENGSIQIFEGLINDRPGEAGVYQIAKTHDVEISNSGDINIVPNH